MGVADPHHHESAMQQLLSDISAAAGTNEVLGFGVGSVTTQRTRGTYACCTCTGVKRRGGAVIFFYLYCPMEKKRFYFVPSPPRA